jgi:antitoxin component of RelBE/YafQ-DinJ toxin-antitoxin module
MAKDDTIHIRLEKTLKQELEDYAINNELKLSNVIRIALEEFAEKDHTRSTTINTNMF